MATPAKVGTCTPSLNYPFMRKTAYVNGYHYVFYSDGSNFKYQSSADGETWGSATTALSSVTTGYNGSITVEEGTNYIHIAGRTSSTNLKYVRGLCGSGGTITFDSEQNITTSSTTDHRQVICVDGNGYAWIVYVVISTQEDVIAVKNANKDGTWSTDTGFPYTVKSNNGANTCPSIDKITNGILVIYGAESGDYNENAYVSGSWGGDTDCGSDVISQVWTNSGLVTYNGKGYIGYFDNSADRIKLMVRTTGGSWSSSEADSSTAFSYNSQVNISVDSSENVYLFVKDPSDTSIVKYKKRTSGGSWDADWTTAFDDEGNTGVEWAGVTSHLAYSGKLGIVWKSTTGGSNSIWYHFISLAGEEATNIYINYGVFS